jgi:hypothetical protein
MKWLFLFGISSLIIWSGKAIMQPKLKYFSISEFGIWWPLMSRDLLLKLDLFREKWGAPVDITSAEGGIGREDESGSQHNVLKWGEVRAVDILPQGMNTSEDRQRAVTIARQVGFTGIGVYPDWKPSAGLHLDVRQGKFASWSAFKVAGVQRYFNLEKGLIT